MCGLFDTSYKFGKKKKLVKGKFYCDDFLKIKFRENYFDAIVSLHTLYHISKNKQEKVVRKLIRISKKNSPIIIVYSNSNTLVNIFKKIIFYKKKQNKKNYIFIVIILDGGKDFQKMQKLSFIHGDLFQHNIKKFYFQITFFGKFLFKILIFFENSFPKIFTKYFQYPIIILKKY